MSAVSRRSFFQRTITASISWDSMPCTKHAARPARPGLPMLRDGPCSTNKVFKVMLHQCWQAELTVCPALESAAVSWA